MPGSARAPDGRVGSVDLRAPRVARMFRELFAGHYAGAEPTLRTFPNTEGYSETVAVTDILFQSFCAHHLLPFYGTAHVAYVPKERLVGLSKLARVVDWLGGGRRRVTAVACLQRDRADTTAPRSGRPGRASLQCGSGRCARSSPRLWTHRPSI